MANNGNGNGDAPGATPKINTDIVTLTRFLTEEQAKHKEATGDFTYVSLTRKTMRRS
jgi:fructose-1,6-bisphosphatase I